MPYSVVNAILSCVDTRELESICAGHANMNAIVSKVDVLQSELFVVSDKSVDMVALRHLKW